MSTQKQIEANRRNSQKSTGPKTEEGKAKSSLNHLSHGLTSNATFVAATPAHQRSQATGLAIAGLSLGQGTAMIAAGAAAQHFSPAAGIATAGLRGTATALVLSIQRLPSPTSPPRVRRLTAITCLRRPRRPDQAVFGCHLWLSPLPVMQVTPPASPA